MDRVALDVPPLTPGLLSEWQACLDAWNSGRKSDAVRSAQALADGLKDLGAAEREAFSRWLCERLFDDGRGWLGQFGGGLSRGDGHWERPADYALSLHPLVSQIVVPFVCTCAHAGGRCARWLFQSLTGLARRVTPADRSRLDAALTEVCGPNATPLDALRRAAVDDERARRWLEQFENGEDFMRVLGSGPPA